MKSNRFLLIATGILAVCAPAVALAQSSEMSLPDQIRAAKSDLKPIDRDAVEAAQADVEEALQQLDAMLHKGSQANAEAWKRFLNWDALNSELESSRPKLTRLEIFLSQLRGSYRGMERDKFQQARTALRRYLLLKRLFDTRGPSSNPEVQLDRLAEAVQRYEETGNGDDATEIRTNLARLEANRQVPDVLQAVRDRYNHQNFFAVVSEEFIEAPFFTKVDEVSTVNDVILGTRIRGTNRTIGHTGVQLVPNENEASLSLTLDAQGTSNSVGVNGPATIRSTSFTDIFVSKALAISQDGIQSSPSWAQCAVNTIYNSIYVRSRLGTNIANRRAYQQKATAEAIAARKAERISSNQFDEGARERIAEGNQQFQDKFVLPLKGRDTFPDSLKFATSSDWMYVRANHANPSQIAASGAAPVFDSTGDVQVKVHESLIANFAESFLANENFTNITIVQLYEFFGAELPDELKGTDRKQFQWLIRFYDHSPVQIDFEDNSVKIKLRIDGFIGDKFGGEGGFVRYSEIEATYDIQIEGEQVVLRRRGDVSVTLFSNNKGEFVVNQSISLGGKAGAIKQEFEDVLKKEVVLKGAKLPAEWNRRGMLKIKSLKTENGWLVGTWSIQPEPELTSTAE